MGEVLSLHNFTITITITITIYHYRTRRGLAERIESIMTKRKEEKEEREKKVNKYDKTYTWSLGAMVMDPAASGCRLFGFGSNDDGYCCLSAGCLGQILFRPGKGCELGT